MTPAEALHSLPTHRPATLPRDARLWGSLCSDWGGSLNGVGVLFFRVFSQNRSKEAKFSVSSLGETFSIWPRNDSSEVQVLANLPPWRPLLTIPQFLARQVALPAQQVVPLGTEPRRQASAEERM
ncbi:hypothetical protein ACOMHN_058172 [Nucella lapillus]